MRVNVTNPSQYSRTEYVIWGSPETTRYTYSSRAGGHLNVGRVHAPPRHDGPVDVDVDGPEPFTLHLAVYKGVTEGGLQLMIRVNGAPYAMEPVEFPTVHPRMLVTVWQARTSFGVCELVTYAFHNQPVIRCEWTFFCESLQSPERWIDIDVAAITTQRHLLWIYGITKQAGDSNITQRLYSGYMGDAQGIPFTGFLAFYTPEMFGDPQHYDTQTILANCDQPLFAIQRWDAWGPWSRPTGYPPSPSGSITEPDPFKHLGYIISKEPRSSGEQAEFGAWHHVSTVSSGSARGMWREYQAARREACRPIWYFEVDGKPVRSQNHPEWTTNDEVIHYNTVVSRDRLGRTHSGSNSTFRWFGHDRQHQGWQFTGEAVLLTGSVALERLIRMQIQNQLAGETIPSMKPGWSTNDPDAGRAVGRTWIMAEFWRRALPHDDADVAALIERMWQRFVQCVRPKWEGLSEPTDPIRPYQITTNPNSGALIGDCWNVWQDGICATGCAALGLSLRALGRLQEAAQVEEMGITIATAIVRYGYTPDYRNSYAYVRRSDGATILDTGTEFARWLLMAVGVLQRATTDPQLISAITQIRTIHEPLARDTYTGTLP